MKFLKDELTLEGHFWICSSPDHKVPGWLVVEADKVELVYWTAMHRPRYLDFPKDSSCRILGELKGRGPITLDGCYHMGNPIPFPPKQFTDAAIKDKIENAANLDEYVEAINIPIYVSDRRVHIGRIFLGYHFEENSPISLDTLTFSIEGLDEWVRVYNDRLWECRDISILSVSRSLFFEAALLHESYLGYHGRMLFFGQFLFSTRYDSGLPKWIIRLRRAQPRRLSTCWLASVRAFNVLPMSCL